MMKYHEDRARMKWLDEQIAAEPKDGRGKGPRRPWGSVKPSRLDEHAERMRAREEARRRKRRPTS